MDKFIEKPRKTITDKELADRISPLNDIEKQIKKVETDIKALTNLSNEINSVLDHDLLNDVPKWLRTLIHGIGIKHLSVKYFIENMKSLEDKIKKIPLIGKGLELAEDALDKVLDPVLKKISKVIDIDPKIPGLDKIDDTINKFKGSVSAFYDKVKEYGDMVTGLVIDMSAINRLKEDFEKLDAIDKCL